MQGNKMLIISAHPGDLLWRCSGSAAKHVANGGEARAIVLTYGTGGEANELIKLGMTIDEVKTQRKADLTKAAKIIGLSDIQFWDLQDYRFEITQDKTYMLAKYLRGYHPDFILTHHGKDILNPDHGTILDYVNMAVEVASGLGIDIAGTKPGLKRAPIFCFEPHASEANPANGGYARYHKIYCDKEHAPDSNKTENQKYAMYYGFRRFHAAESRLHTEFISS